VTGIAALKFSQLGGVVLYGLSQTEEKGSALSGWRPGPSRVCSCRCFNGSINVRYFCLRDLGQHAAIMRIHDLERGAVQRLDKVAVDEES